MGVAYCVPLWMRSITLPRFSQQLHVIKQTFGFLRESGTSINLQFALQNPPPFLKLGCPTLETRAPDFRQNSSLALRDQRPIIPAVAV